MSSEVEASELEGKVHKLTDEITQLELKLQHQSQSNNGLQRKFPERKCFVCNKGFVNASAPYLDFFSSVWWTRVPRELNHYSRLCEG